MKPICRNFTTSPAWPEKCRLGRMAQLSCKSCSAYDPDATEHQDKDNEGWGELMKEFEIKATLFRLLRGGVNSCNAK
jgi:hypothetical protein